MVQGSIAFDTIHAPSIPLLVNLVSPRGPTFSSFTDAGGNFTFTGIPAGTYFLQASVEGFQDVSQRVDVPRSVRFLVFMNRKADLPPDDETPYGGSHIVDLRELTIPKEAVREHEKALDDIEDGDIESAIARLEQAVELAPDFFEAHVTLAEQYRGLERFADAETQWIRAAEIRVHDAWPLVELGRMYTEQEDWGIALDILERAVDRDPKNAAGVYYFSLALYESSEYDAAETLLSDFLRRYPGTGPLQLMLANVLIRQNRPIDAVEQIDAFLDQHPEDLNRAAALETRKQLLNFLLTANP
jgi:tetratricopeptide (TPR) repeat protein